MTRIIPAAVRLYEFKSHLKLGIIVALANLVECPMKRWYGLGGILFLMSGSTVLADGFAAYDRVTGLPHASRSEVIAPHGMAATSQPLATQVALDILKAGGTAVDAAIAANAALGLMEPTGSGIGGDIFAIVWDADKQELTGLNASGRAPALMTIEY